MQDLATLWQAVLDKLELNVSNVSFIMWFKPLKVLDFSDENKKIVVSTNSSSAKNQIMRNYFEKLSSAIKDIFGQNVAVMALQHHEKLDGSGYPLGIKGHQIGLGARIIAVADTFDAIVEGRPYSNKKSINEAIDILNSIKGTQLDATVVAALISILTEENLYHK